MTQPLNNAFIQRTPVTRYNHPPQNISSLELMTYQKSCMMTKWDSSQEGKDGFKPGKAVITCKGIT